MTAKPFGEWTVAQTEGLLLHCLQEQDVKGAGLCMRLLAVKDPERAEELRQVLLAGLAIAAEGVDE